MERVVEPEILDDLSPQDPEAVASRRDLKRINFLMGNERWILGRVAEHREKAANGIVEWGAGEGLLLRRLAEYGPATGMDLVARPEGLNPSIGWESGDLTDRPVGGGILVINLFLHHFKGEALRLLGRKLAGFQRVIGIEPLRSRGALILGSLLMPFVSRVTRHDMPVSIRAGFLPGELASDLGLEAEHWDLEEETSMLGGLRWVARRRPKSDDPSGDVGAEC